MSTTEPPLTFEQILAGFNEIKKMQQETSLRMQDADRRMQETERIMNERHAKTEKELDKFLKAQKEMSKEIGGIGKSNGEYAEEFFTRAMKRTNTFGGIAYNWVGHNWAKNQNDIKDEYDIVLHNGSSIAVIEVKYKFKRSDLAAFITRKLPHFRILYPEYAGKKIYLGIAGFSFEDSVIEEAKSRGIGVLRKDGKNVEYDDSILKEF